MQRPIVALLLTLVVACGGGAQDQRPSTSVVLPTVQVAERLVIEGENATEIVDPATGRLTATLPGGVLSPAADLIVRANGAPQKTAVLGTDLGGQPALTVALSGDYKFPDAYGAAPSGFSPNGKWLVLVSRDASESRFAVIDVEHGAVATTVALSARFTFDAIHNDGSAMYLIEHPVLGGTAYNVRLYDLRQKTLLPDIIFDKAAIAQFDPTIGLMDGTFHVSVAPKTGDWSFGLYMRPSGSPFVHALNVPGRYATCIVDLAGVWTASSRFSMALRDDGRMLYVVDPGMGTISVIDALTQKVDRRATFAGRPGDGEGRTASAIVSHDGKTLYASAARGIAVLSTADLRLVRWAATDVAVRSLALSRDGSTLFALTAEGVQNIDASSGAVRSQLVAAPGARAIHLVSAP